MWIGNAMLVILNLPLIGLWVKLLSVPYRLLYPLILYAAPSAPTCTNNNMFDVWSRHRLRLAGFTSFEAGL